MINRVQKYIITIPDHVTVLYSESTQVVVLTGVRGTKSLALPVKLVFLEQTNHLKVTRFPFSRRPNNLQKKQKAVQGLIFALLKQMIVDVSLLRFKKLRLEGLGYKIFQVSQTSNAFFYCKLGYSHVLYFKVPFGMQVLIKKANKVSIFGNSFQQVAQLASVLRSYRIPDPYKGKGVLYETESIKLKKGKKV